MLPPKYQEYKKERIPKYQKDGVWCNVIAGSVYGMNGIITTDTPTVYVHVVLQPGAYFCYEIPPGLKNNFNVMCYVTSGGK